MRPYFGQDVPFTGQIAASKKALVDLSAEGIIRRILLKCESGAGVALTQAQMLTDIQDIDVQANSKAIRDRIPLQVLFDLHNYYNAARGYSISNDGFVPIYFSQPHLERIFSLSDADAAGKQELIETGPNSVGLGTLGLNNIKLEVRFTAALATLGKLYARVEYLPLQAAPGKLLIVETGPLVITGAGWKSLAQDWYPSQSLAAIHFHDLDSCVIEEMNFRRNRVEELAFNSYGADPEYHHILEEAGRTPQAGYYHMDMLTSNRLRDAPKLVGGGKVDPRVRVTTAPLGGSVNITTESYVEFADL